MFSALLYSSYSRGSPCLFTSIQWLVRLIGFLFISSSVPASAVILWSVPGATRVHETGAGSDILGGALKRDETSNDTLYFKFRVDPLSDLTTEEYFAAFELYEGDS